MSDRSIDGDLRSPASNLDLDAGLQRLGYRDFRPGQQRAIEVVAMTRTRGTRRYRIDTADIAAQEARFEYREEGTERCIPV